MQVSKPTGWKQGYTANRLLLIQSNFTTFLAGACLEQRPTGAVWYFTGSELVPSSQGGKRWKLELLSKARHGLML